MREKGLFVLYILSAVTIMCDRLSCSCQSTRHCQNSVQLNRHTQQTGHPYYGY